MTKLGLRTGVLVFLLVGACTNDDTAEGDATGTDSATTQAGDGDGDGCTPPPGVYGDCATSTDACMTDGPKLCILDSQDFPSIAVCARRCTDVCDCWAAPADGDAPVACLAIDMSGDNTCVLDCSGGQTCPSGMFCTGAIGAELCVFEQ